MAPPAPILDARLSSWRLWTGLVLSPALIAMCAGLIYMLWRRREDAQFDEFRVIVYTAVFGLMALFFVTVFITFIIELRARTALQPVTVNAQHYVAIIIDDAVTRRAGSTWLWALNRRAARLQKRPKLSINLSMLDVDPQLVLALLQQIVPEKMRAPVTQWRIPVP